MFFPAGYDLLKAGKPGLNSKHRVTVTSTENASNSVKTTLPMFLLTNTNIKNTKSGVRYQGEVEGYDVFFIGY